MGQRSKVEPLVWRSLNSAVVKIESVDVDVNDSHCNQLFAVGIDCRKCSLDFCANQTAINGV